MYYVHFNYILWQILIVLLSTLLPSLNVSSNLRFNGSFLKKNKANKSLKCNTTMSILVPHFWNTKIIKINQRLHLQEKCYFLSKSVLVCGQWWCCRWGQSFSTINIIDRFITLFKNYWLSSYILFTRYVLFSKYSQTRL